MIDWQSFGLGALTMINVLGIAITFFGTGRYVSKSRETDRG